MPHGYRQSNARLVWLMCPHLSANYVADCPPNMEGILTDTEFRSMTLNDLFQIHLDTTKLAESTKKNYCRMWESLVKNDLGQMKVVQVRPSQL